MKRHNQENKERPNKKKEKKNLETKRHPVPAPHEFECLLSVHRIHDRMAEIVRWGYLVLQASFIHQGPRARLPKALLS